VKIQGNIFCGFSQFAMQLRGKNISSFVAVHHANTGGLFFMYFRSPPCKYRGNNFHVFSQSTMQIQGQYFSCVFTVHHTNTEAISCMEFLSPPCKYRAVFFVGFRSSPCKTRTIFVMDFRSPPCKTTKNNNFLWFLAVYHANTGIIFSCLYSVHRANTGALSIFLFLHSTVRAQRQYLFFFVFRSPPCTHRDRP
jgi:hypothetical protein